MDSSNQLYSSQMTRPWPSSQVRIIIFNMYCSPTDTALAEKQKGVIPKSAQTNPKHKHRAGRVPSSDSDEDSEAVVDAMVTPKKVDKGKAKATTLHSGLHEDPAPKVCYLLLLNN